MLQYRKYDYIYELKARSVVYFLYFQIFIVNYFNLSDVSQYYSSLIASSGSIFASRLIGIKAPTRQTPPPKNMAEKLNNMLISEKEDFIPSLAIK